MSMHKTVSIWKSVFRLIGCLGAASGNVALAVAWLSVWFAAAEVLGIVEEIGEP